MLRWDDFVEDHPRATEVLSRIRRYLPPLNFITLHYAYFILVPLITSVIFWGSSKPAYSISYVDSLFLVVSAMTEAGLNTVNLSQMTTWQQVMLWFLIMLGSTIWVSIWTVLARKHVFEQRFKDIVRAQRFATRLGRTGSAVSFGLPLMRRFTSFRKGRSTLAAEPALPGTGSRAAPPPPTPSLGGNGRPDEAVSGRWRTNPAPPELEPEDDLGLPRPAKEKDVETAVPPANPSGASGRVAFVDSLHPNPNGVAATNGFSTSSLHVPDNQNHPSRRHNATPGTGTSDKEHDEKHLHFDMRHFLAHRQPGRNAQFHDLTSEEREHLGGCEYRALKILAITVPMYFFLWQLLGCIALGAWINNYMPNTATSNGIDPWWLGIFNGVSAFNNSGMSLLDANMIPFERAYFVLIVMGLMILAGNTAYPLFLRLTVWSCLKFLKMTTAEHDFCELKATFEFILKYPRRVYTNLFPARPTWWLFFMLICLNSVDWAAFELLNLGNPVIESIPAGPRVLDAVRSGGFYVVPISSVYIGLQVLYVIMMYISVYPVVITMRNSNVYEERSLGIYSDETPSSSETSDTDLESAPTTATNTLPPMSRIRSDLLPSSGLPLTPRLPPTPGLTRRLSRSAGAPAAELGRTLRRTFTTRWQGVGVPPSPHPGPRRPGSGAPESRISFMRQQIHGQLAHDIWWLVVAVLVIVTIETSHFIDDPVTYSVFNVIFEVVSAYGCVGISVGLPYAAYSFSGGWHAPSKLVLCLVMLRGRHRGLPVALDRAVRLPGEQLHRDEDEDWRIRRSMTSRRMSGEWNRE